MKCINVTGNIRSQSRSQSRPQSRTQSRPQSRTQSRSQSRSRSNTRARPLAEAQNRCNRFNDLSTGNKSRINGKISKTARPKTMPDFQSKASNNENCKKSMSPT